MSAPGSIVTRIARSLLITTNILVLLMVVLSGIAAFGIPGHWLRSYLPEHLTIGKISYLPSKGLMIHNLLFIDDGEPFIRFSKATADFTLFSTAPFTERITALTIDDLYVAQLDPNSTITEPPSFEPINLPVLNHVAVTLHRADILDIRAELGTATLTTTTRRIEMSNIKLKVDNDEDADGNVVVDFDTEVANIILRCHLHPHQLNGIWRAINIPIIEEYIGYFNLRTPAWGEGKITVGLNKFDNIFDFEADLVAPDGGSYQGVSFDNATCHLTSKGISDCVTTFSNVVTHRKGKQAASGSLSFDCGKDLFSFYVKSDLLTPEECLAITELPFKDALQSLTVNDTPHFELTGSLPFLTEQTADKIRLSGTLDVPQGGAIDMFYFKNLTADISMANGTLAFNHLKIGLPSEDGKLEGSTSFTFPPGLAYTDIHAAFHLKDVVKKDISMSFVDDPNEIPYIVLNGFFDLHFRTDETFKKSLHGNFDITGVGEIITRSRLFSGLIALFADYIPGMSGLMDDSTAHLVGTIDHGIFNIPEFAINGNLFSLDGPVNYNFPNDYLFARISAGNFKQGSVIGTLTRWATLRVNNYVWQIRVQGPLNELDWHIDTFVNKLWDKTLGTEEEEKLGIRN